MNVALPRPGRPRAVAAVGYQSVVRRCERQRFSLEAGKQRPRSRLLQWRPPGAHAPTVRKGRRRNGAINREPATLKRNFRSRFKRLRHLHRIGVAVGVLLDFIDQQNGAVRQRKGCAPHQPDKETLMTRVNYDAPTSMGRYRLAGGIWLSALLALGPAPASAQNRSGQQRAIDITVTELGLPGTFQVLINDRGLVFGTDGSTGVNFVLDTRTGAFDGSVPSFDPFDINKRGEVVGMFDAPRSAGGTQGAVWTKEDGRRLSATFLARGINTHGDMAGNCIVGIDQVGPPCVLIRGHHGDPGSGVIHVIDVDADSAALVAINNHRVAVGNVSDADGSQRAFTWSLTDGVRFLDAPPSTSRFATAINNHGLIAGAIQGENVSHPTMWSAGSGRIAATLTGFNGLALAINDHGVLLVNALNQQTGQFEYDVWVPSRHIVAVLSPADPTATGVVASDINNRGEIIGSQYHAGPDGGVLSSELIMWQIAIRGAHR